MRALPTKHLSARVPWHDNKWNGTVCCNALDNSFCRILPRVDTGKDLSFEQDHGGRQLSELSIQQMPPCLEEKGAFLSEQEYVRPTEHSWAKINPLFKNFLPGIYHHKPYSINAVPFLWMMKNAETHQSDKALTYELAYDPEKEKKVKLGFDRNIWVQHPDNQKELLDAFFGCLKPRESLIFFYSKHTPLSEPNERVIVGVARVKSVGDINHYSYPEGYQGHRSYVWDRCVTHTLTPKDRDGFLMPYHELLDHARQTGEDVPLRDYAAFAPDLLQFSYASELVEHDTAIDSLFAMAESLKKSARILENNFSKELEWIDNRVSEIWDMRGAFPGMGPMLAALQFENANSIAWEIEKFIVQRDGDLFQTNPWDVLEAEVSSPGHLLGDRGKKLMTPTNQTLWRTLPKEKKQLLLLLSRCQLNNDQAKFLWKAACVDIGTVRKILDNPYMIYEKTRSRQNGLSFQQMDKAVLPVEKIRAAFPIPAPSTVVDFLDRRRVRALVVQILEEAAAAGHSLLPVSDILDRSTSIVSDPPCPINADILLAYAEDDFFHEEVILVGDEPMLYLKLKRLAEIKQIIRTRVDRNLIVNKTYGIELDWLALVNDEFKDSDSQSTPSAFDMKAREEKAEALKTLCNYRFSVLIGPAGAGKTTLLRIFEKIPEIQSGGVLKLAPTGKARVKLGTRAQTLAQFLHPHRYDGLTGTYYANPEAPKISGAQTVIVDEASMLTEDQLAALFDALGAVKRLILVGDYRQLPPIGTGRPFVDIVKLLRPGQFAREDLKVGPAYAELVQILRQSAADDNLERLDVTLSRCFGDTVHKHDLEKVYEIASRPAYDDGHLRLVKWYDSLDLRQKLQEVLKEELQLADGKEEWDFNLRIGAKEVSGYQYFNVGEAEKSIEQWQILSPVNGYGYGVREVNKYIQSRYRQSFVDLAQNVQPEGAPYYRKPRVAKPKGLDGFVYGDKVINLRNTTWHQNQWIKPVAKKESALRYIANGEVGIVTGEFRGKASPSKDEPNVEIAFSTQPGYSYVFWPNQLKEDGDYSLELAYCITVHKAQGSGFGKVFFILPSGGSILSRELLYTALTRQEEKVTILHQGEFHEFLKFASDSFSETARRLTDLFALPDLKEISQKRYDSRYVNISERGEPMLSKNEVIIANTLLKYERQGLITYAYEDKFKLSDGRAIKPDFTIEHVPTGRVFYWEHLGMMTMAEYRDKWERKLEGYRQSGIVPFQEADPDSDKILIVTEEQPNGGVNSQYFDQLIKQVILEEDGEY
ncbi:ATP-dependent DNA helicase [Brevibacillus agri]